MLTKVGFTIVALICDNHRMNRSMYCLLNEFSSEKGSISCISASTSSYKSIFQEIISSIIHPFNPEKEIFLLFDTVHLFESIRNNWLNQTNPEESFVFPHFDNSQMLSHANLSDLKKVYSKECNNICREAPALSKKVLYPSSLERQNSSLAVKLFDEKNIAAF